MYSLTCFIQHQRLYKKGSEFFRHDYSGSSLKTAHKFTKQNRELSATAVGTVIGDHAIP